MNPRKGGVIIMVIGALIVGFLIGVYYAQWRANQRAGRDAGVVTTGVQTQPAAGQPGPAKSDAQTIASRSVTINGQRLSDQDVETFERTFRIQVRDGDYWYDRMNGSWGLTRGPVAGFILAGLDLGGPLREDASNGDTGVFINGRQLHRVDVARLAQIGPVYPGRCWMDALGNIGIEGQPAFGNIWVAVQALSGGTQKEGILSTYDKTGIAVIGY